MRVLKLAVIAVVLGIVVIVGIGVFTADSNNAAALQQLTSGGSPQGVTLAKYNRLADGMTYADAIGILGAPGTEMSRSSLGGTTTVMYSWQGSGDIGANMNAMFQDDRLVSKAQFNLK